MVEALEGVLLPGLLAMCSHGAHWNLGLERCTWQYHISMSICSDRALLNPQEAGEDSRGAETFNVPALFIFMRAVLSLDATRHKPGVALDSRVTHAVPIYESIAMANSMMQVGTAGRDISLYLWLLLHKKGADFHTSAEFEAVQTIKEQTCSLSISSQNVSG